MITLIEDTRNQPGKHKAKNEYWKSQGIKVIRSKLPCGDYALLTDMSTVVDSKKGIDELVSNLCGKQHERFKLHFGYTGSIAYHIFRYARYEINEKHNGVGFF